METPKAMTDATDKLARMIYHMVTAQQPCDTTIVHSASATSLLSELAPGIRKLNADKRPFTTSQRGHPF